MFKKFIYFQMRRFYGLKYKLFLAYLKITANKVGNIKIYGSFTITHPYNFSIGDNTSINEGVFIGCRNVVEIGKNCHLSPYVQIHTGKLNMKKRKRNHESASVIIEDNVWKASGSIISAGIKIGRNSIIGANSVVLSDIEENSFYAGNPAKKIKELEYNELLDR